MSLGSLGSLESWGMLGDALRLSGQPLTLKPKALCSKQRPATITPLCGCLKRLPQVLLFFFLWGGGGEGRELGGGGVQGLGL